MTDVWLTFWLDARFSPDRRDQLLNAPTAISRSLIFPAREAFPQAFKDFTGGTSLVFNITSDMLPKAEKNRTVTNVAVMFIGHDLPKISATLSSSSVAGAAFTTPDQGLAHSNLLTEPASSMIKPPASSLDPLASGSPDQVWTVTLGPKVDAAAIQDVWLGIEYSAQAVFPGH
jgi:hypothetical protein